MADRFLNDPIKLLCADAQRAMAAGDPMAHRCFLATLTDPDQPALRTLVLRGVDSGRIDLFFSNTSAKWRDLVANSRYELLVYWPTIECQYRVRGRFEQIPFDELAASWKQKSVEGKLLDLYYAKKQAQGSLIDDIDAFVETIASIRVNSGDLSAFEAPPTIGGIRLEPERIERLDLSPAPTVYARHLFVRINGGWRRDVLVP